MKKLLKDSEGNVFKANILSGSIPDGYVDISHIEIPEELKDLDYKYLCCTDEDIIVKKDTADADRRNLILAKLRELRAPLLADADIAINISEDMGRDTAQLRMYRRALRNVPQRYIKVDGDPKVSVDSINLENFKWPEKPE